MTLVYLANSFVFVGSHYGDSQLVRLPSSSNASGAIAKGDGDMEVDAADATGRLEVMNSFTNLAPILDFVLVETDAFGSVRPMFFCFLALNYLGSTDLHGGGTESNSDMLRSA
jgi:hypothetical protein